MCLTIVTALQNFLRNKKIFRVIYFLIIFSDKIYIKINIYIFCNRAFWKHVCEPRRARHMRGNVTRNCVTSWVHPCRLILTRACVMLRITQTLCFLGIRIRINPFRGTFFCCTYSRHESVYKGFWGHWLQIWSQIFKIHNGGFNMADKILKN